MGRNNLKILIQKDESGGSGFSDGWEEKSM